MSHDTFEVDVLIVGGGPAGLSAALRLAQLRKQVGGEPMTVALLEKSKDIGSHMLSGAILDPSSLKDLIPDWKKRSAPIEVPVCEDRLYFLTERRKIRFPIIPSPLKNHGNYIISLNKFVRWLGDLAEAEGVDVFTGFSGVEIIYEGKRIVGVKTGDRGIDRYGERKSTFEPGVEIRSKITIFADGVRGNLTKQLIRRFSLDEGKLEQVYAIGIKELWEVPQGRLEPGTVIHTMGYPQRMEEYGGGFLYALPEGRLSMGFVSGLDYRDPMFDPYVSFQHFKRHPLVSDFLADGRMIRYGAKAIPEGGWHTIPRCYADGALIIGDAAGFLNSVRLKGIHLAMKTGLLAADVAFDAVRTGDLSSDYLKKFKKVVQEGSVRQELYPVRNIHQSFGRGLLAGLSYSALSMITRGLWPRKMFSSQAGHTRIMRLAEYYKGSKEIADRRSNIDEANSMVSIDKSNEVYYSGTRHEEDQRSHLIVQDTDVCRTQCREEYGNPCLRFCPANVYEMVEIGKGPEKRLQINSSNCLHCKVCDIMDPYQIIDWVPPEGGGGPQYEGM